MIIENLICDRGETLMADRLYVYCCIAARSTDRKCHTHVRGDKRRSENKNKAGGVGYMVNYV